MNIGFWTNQLCERGTETAVYDYAYFNQMLLNNRSFVFYEKNHRHNHPQIIDKFSTQFSLFPVKHFDEVDPVLLANGISVLYIIKAGTNDGKLSTVAKNCVHCVFNCTQPHGDIYSAISPWIEAYQRDIPVVPHMVNLPNHDRDLRDSLGISPDAVVFGSYGARGSFNIPYVCSTVHKVAQAHPEIYFLSANYPRFCPSLPNIVHLPLITELEDKVAFINTCDAMLWARRRGETFGLAIAEFSSKNRPVIVTKRGCLAYWNLLGRKAIHYHNGDDLTRILTNFDRPALAEKDWNAYRDFTPEKVMHRFKEIYLDRED